MWEGNVRAYLFILYVKCSFSLNKVRYHLFVMSGELYLFFLLYNVHMQHKLPSDLLIRIMLETIFLIEKKVLVSQLRVNKQTNSPLTLRDSRCKVEGDEQWELSELYWCQLEFKMNCWSTSWQPGESQRGENRIARQTDGQKKERRKWRWKRWNVKSGALEGILAGNLSYHSDLVKALQQIKGERAREQTLRYCVSHGLGLSEQCFLHG